MSNFVTVQVLLCWLDNLHYKRRFFLNVIKVILLDIFLGSELVQPKTSFKKEAAQNFWTGTDKSQLALKQAGFHFFVKRHRLEPHKK